MQDLACGEGLDAAALVSSLHSRLSTFFDVNDIIIIAKDRFRLFSPGTLTGGGAERVFETASGAFKAPREEGTAYLWSPACPVLLLAGLCDSVLDVIGDCQIGDQGEVGSQNMSKTAMGVVAAGSVSNHEVVLRSACRSLLELVTEPGTVPSGSSQQSTSGIGAAADDLLDGHFFQDGVSVRSGYATASHLDKVPVSPLVRRHCLAVNPIRQLIALRFYLQAMRRWPRLAVNLMREIQAWKFFFSDLFLTGGSCLIAQAMENLKETPTCADLAFVVSAHGNDDRSGCGSCSSDDEDAIGWGIVHDAVLLLLETVVVIRRFLHVESPPAKSIPDEHRQEKKQKKSEECLIGDGGLASNGSETQEYLRFLAEGESGRNSALTVIQGCRWLSTIVARESAVGRGLLMPLALRGASLRLALKLCDRGIVDGSETPLPKTLVWPLMHSSFSLALDLVSGVDEGSLLFQAAVAAALNAKIASATLSATTKPRTHHPTTSMASDASSADLHATRTGWTPGNGGSCTPASINSFSPTSCLSLAFADSLMPPHQLLRPLPEMLFRAALDSRVRYAAFNISKRLALEASREVLVPSNIDVGSLSWLNRQQASAGTRECDTSKWWASRETAAEILSGLVEGYLCLCERAMVSISLGSASTEDGVDLLFDAICGACTLMCPGTLPSATRGEGSRPINSGRVGRRGVATDKAQLCFKIGESGISPLLQEAFGEHSASARLLTVLESVVAGPITSRSTSIPVVTTATYSEVVRVSLSFFTALMTGNSPGKNAFRQAIAEHTISKVVSPEMVPSLRPGAAAAAGKGVDDRSFAALADLVCVVPPATLFEALVEMLMDGEAPPCLTGENKAEGGCWHAEGGGNRNGGVEKEAGMAATNEDPESVFPPEIQNPLVVPLIFRLLPDWPVAEQARAMNAFRFLLMGAGGGMVNRSVCCDVQPTLMDQVRRRMS